MDLLYQQIRGTDFSNWLDVAVGISFTTKGISDYLEHTILSLHHTIKYGACAQLPNCRRNCSKIEQHLSSWCVTCTEWKKQIMSYNRYRTRARQIKWKNINSSEWPQNVNEMVKVFAPEWWRSSIPYTEDLPVALHVFHNCTKFNIPIRMCNRVKDIRNALYAHGLPQVKEVERKKALTDFVTFLKSPEFSHTESGKLALLQLNSLKSNCVIDLIKDDGAFKLHIVNVLNPQNDADRPVLDQCDNVRELRACLHEEKKVNVNGKLLQASLFILGLVLVLLGRAWHSGGNETTLTKLYKEKDCLPLTFSDPCPWEPDFTFDGYLTDRPTLFGRKWLIDKIQTSLMATSSRGVLLTAEMGYGKSTLVSHLLCTAEQAHGSGLREYIVSYHICKFDVISTQRPEYFIRNLVGMLISKLPEAGNAILTNKLAMDFLQTSKCSEDPVGCIDAAVIHPLRGLTFDEERYVIIDAIDECGESAAIAMSLLDVLAKRIGKMPWWLKFFITARDISIVTSKFPQLQILHETSQDVQNQNDIATFLDHNLFKHTTSFSRLFGTPANITDITEQVLRISGSNFLYVDLAVKFWIDSPNSQLTDIPQSLNELYAINLDRVFGDNQHLYGLARKVFEVLCTSYKRLQLGELEAILNVTKYPYDLRNLLGNQISHFVYHRMYISIYHKAICDYLTSNSSDYSKYHISKYNGHTMFANYLLSKYNNSMTDILNLFIHVAEAKDDDLLHAFQHSKYLIKMNMSSDYHLHQMAKNKNSFLGTKLLIRVLGSEHINNLTSANVTATFLAAAFGNSETLRALIEEGGDYLFKVRPPPNKGGLEDAVNYCKYKALWGYGLLDIASQNGHTEVVNLLLTKNQTLVYFINGLMLNAVHLASEHGHTDILDKLLEINNTLADQHSLYLASKNGHLRCVLSLLKHGAKDACVQCEDNINWINNTSSNTKRMQWHPCSNISEGAECDLTLLVSYNEVENVTFVLNDDERLIKCTTALDIAVQRGHKEIVSHLLSQTTNALFCREYGGRTPLLSAIKYNQSELLDIILEKGGNVTDKCARLYNSTVRHSLRVFNINERTSLEKDMCPLGAGVEHFIAMNGRIEIANRLLSKGISLNLTLQAESGNTPLHYAACNNEWQMVQALIHTGNVNIYMTAINGSLPIHSAVLCNAVMSYRALHPHYITENKQLVDNEGRGLLHYLVLGTEYTKDVNSMLYMVTSDKYKLNTSTKDTNSSNFLHYAAQTGNHLIIFYLCVRSIDTSLLLEVNNINKTVIDVAFDNLPQQKEDRVCVDCSFADLFGKQLNNLKYDEILTEEELVIFRIFQIISEHSDIRTTVDFRKYQRLAVIKGNAFILYSILMFQPRPLDVSDKDLLTAFFSAERPSANMIYILVQFTSNFCNKTFEESLIHRVIRNENNKYWIYFVNGELIHVLSRKSFEFWDNCYDRDGYNILQHAVMGGNYVAVEFMVKSGMTLDGFPSFTPIDLVSLGVSHADIYVMDRIGTRPWMEYRTTYIDEGESQLIHIYREQSFFNLSKNFDKTNSYFLSEILKRNKLKFSHFCKTKSKHLSLVHRAAIKGHQDLLMTMYDGFGKRVLQCTNAYSFTSLYFAKLFDHSDVVKYLQSKSVSEILPYNMAELVFLQMFAADNVSVLMDVPAYAHFIVRLLHPYLYNMKPRYNAIFQRTLMRLCFDIDKTLTELSEVLQNTPYVANDMRDILANFSNHTLDKLNFTREDYMYNTPNSEIFPSLINQNVIFLTSFVQWFHQKTLMLRYPDSETDVYYRKLTVNRLIESLYQNIILFHELYITLRTSVIAVRTVSVFHLDRIFDLGNHYQRNMTLQTVKDFYTFRRKFIDNIATGHLPSKSDVSSAHFLTLDSSIRFFQWTEVLKIIKMFDPRSNIFNKKGSSRFPLHDE